MTYVPPVIPPSGKVPNVSRGMVADLNAAFDAARTMSAALVDHDARIATVNVRTFGAVGDWDGSTGTDNLPAFNAAMAAAASGGPSKIIIPAGDYWLSNAWVLDGDNVEVEADVNAVIRTTSATAYVGSAVAFIGNGIQSPADVSTPQRDRFSWKGGTIYATGSGTSDNALGVVRVKNCHVSDVTLDADRKGFTAQYGVDNLVVERILVTRGDYAGVTVETQCNRVVLRDIHVITTDGIGVQVTADLVTNRCSDVVLDNVNIDYAAGVTGVYIRFTDRVTIRKTRVVAAVTQGLYVYGTTDLSISGDSFFPSVTIGSDVTFKKPPKQTIALGNSWVAYGAPHETPCAYRTTDGMVVLDGAMKNGTTTVGTVFGTLPLGVRPGTRVKFIAETAGTTPSVDVFVNPDGQMAFATLPGSALVSLSGITFPSI